MTALQFVVDSVINVKSWGRQLKRGCTAAEIQYDRFRPCGMGVRIQPTPALRRVVRGDYLRDMSYPIAYKVCCGCCEKLVFRVCGARQNFYMFCLYRNPDLDDRIYDCLLTAMAAVQAADARASFLFVGDLNGHHQEWLGATTMNRHGVAALDFATVSGCDQLVIGPSCTWRNS